jgi:hypothetical protein
MSLLTVEGTYKDGKVSLLDPPAGVREARVIVTFLPENVASGESRMMTFGQLRVEGERMSDDQDFKAAEWHPKPEDLDV